MMETTCTTAGLGHETLTQASLTEAVNRLRPFADEIKRAERQLMLHCAANVDKWLSHWIDPNHGRKKCSTRKSKTEGKRAAEYIRLMRDIGKHRFTFRGLEFRPWRSCLYQGGCR